jgi:hypothetical protein
MVAAVVHTIHRLCCFYGAHHRLWQLCAGGSCDDLGFTAVFPQLLQKVETMKNLNVAILWDIATRSQYVNRFFVGTYRLHVRGRKSAEQETSVAAGGKAEL